MQLRLVLMLALWLPFYMWAQPGFRPASARNLIMEGGALRGIAYGGALEELGKRGMLDSIVRVGGNSAGAVYAMMLAIGYNTEEISNISYCTPAKKFINGNTFWISGFWRITKYFGWNKGRHMYNWLGELIEEKTGNAGLTFRQLHEMVLKNEPGKRDLYVTGSNLTKQRLEIFSWETYPDMKIRDAVRISAGIPLYFQAIFMDSTGRIYSRLRPDQKTDVMVDGGIIGNYPINIFDQRRFVYGGKDTAYSFNWQTLGIRLDSKEQIEADKKGEDLVPYPIENFDDFMVAFYYMVLENLNRPHLVPDDWKRTISVSTAGLPPRILKISEKERSILMEGGRKAVREFLAKKQ